MTLARIEPKTPARRWTDVALPVSFVKVFSVTKSRDRNELGERVTVWLAAHPNVSIAKTVVSLTSDREFHCMSIVLFGQERAPFVRKIAASA